MIDIHSHIIFGIDDGPATLNESIKMIYEAEEVGIKVIFATPHFRNNFVNSQKIIDHYYELVYRARNCELELTLGCEILINSLLSGGFENIKTLTLGNSKYMLVKFPLNCQPVYYLYAIKNMQLNGIIPIIANPERNIHFLSDIRKLLDFIDIGCLIQIDAASTIGIYGDRIRNFTRKLLCTDLVNFIASNAYNSYGFTEWYLKSYMNVVRWIGEERTYNLFHDGKEIVMKLTKDSTINKKCVL